MPDYGYLHFGDAHNLPMHTIQVPIHHEYADKYQALWEGRWRRVYITVKYGTYIKYGGKKITIQIDGV